MRRSGVNNSYDATEAAEMEARARAAAPDTRWTVIVGRVALGRHRVCVRCACGTEREIRKDGLVGGTTRSCGCLSREQALINVQIAHQTPRTIIPPEVRFWRKVVGGDAIDFIVRYGYRYAANHASPTCTGYSQGTVAIPNRLSKYDRLIGATREALLIAGRPYVIENVYGARHELNNPVMLCGRMFALGATDDDGTVLTLDRHRMFEVSGFPLMVPEHVPHDWRSNRAAGIQVAGAYGGARRDKTEAREVRRGGYVPSLAVMRDLLGTPWMSEKGCQLSIPPAYTEFIGAQLLAAIESERAA